MNNNRRDFLKLSGLAALGGSAKWEIKDLATSMQVEQGKQVFNMSGYAAPKIETVRIGFIGLGNRGSGAITRVNRIDGVKTVAVCDIRKEKTAAALNALGKMGIQPIVYGEKEEAWKAMCDRPDIDLIYIATPWHLHTPMAVYAMKQGKHVAVEVPAATTLEECWQLVETSEKTKKHCMMLENCCYDFFELLTLNMARQGYFGEIIHAEGAYLHDLLDHNFTQSTYYQSWRLKENLRNGNLYPTHGLGPICQLLDINRGDQMDYLVSTSTNDFSMHARAVELAAKDPFYQQFTNKSFRGNMNTTTIRTVKGKTMMVQHDVSTSRPYSRIHLLSGTKGMAVKYPDAKISDHHHNWISAAEMAELEKKYAPPIVAKIGELAKQIGGHGGMDFMMDWRLIDCLRNGLPLDQNVYDAATWSAVGPLSEMSVKNRSRSMNVPDFTRGSWKSNTPVDITLAQGGSTGVKAQK
ncbi:Gfo/Idh/MocA family oxidoreductase [Cytophagaceae bacterium 50C-KIRBA]|uniref:Gfo/Idh/MocA family oxidoreductase n=1 Tax=Aquirufa beregesia TaxID=2516556 RepID=A0ABX0EYX6_9BACT|nr:Gfo/Idh/MocA family oxidoreductase [Aquirufa beregesia]NGZ44462.1 Gfo/Idh/MocA family oxidoreductase [Aquirufa beregesia]